MTAIVTALMNTNKFRVVSRPSVFTSNLKKAVIASGTEIAVPQNIQSSINSVTPGTNGVVTNSSVTYKPVELKLTVIPLINADREVELEIVQENSEIAGSTRIDNNDIPTISRRYVKTHVTVPDQATLVLGGLIKVSTNKVRSGIPISATSRSSDTFSAAPRRKDPQELVILIRPEVSWSKEEDVRQREKHQEFFSLPPDLEPTVYPQTTRTGAAGSRARSAEGAAGHPFRPDGKGEV